MHYITSISIPLFYTSYHLISIYAYSQKIESFWNPQKESKPTI
jgi:hypothetical protein